MLNRTEVIDWCVISFVLSLMVILPTFIFLIDFGSEIARFILTIIEAPLLLVQLFFGYRILARKGKYMFLKLWILIPIYYITIKAYIALGVNFGTGFGV